MIRSGISFTEEEMQAIETIERDHPELKVEFNPTRWRRYFDKQKRDNLSNTRGLDELIKHGMYGDVGIDTSHFATISARMIRDDCTRIMYAQTKARVFNILESQFDEGTRLEAVKRAVEDVLSGVSDNIDNYLRKSIAEGYKIVE